jgi:D-alanyl-D-alanine-carboxypeptidase/D-alanyl-D-alanine-endopeptidase
MKQLIIVLFFLLIQRLPAQSQTIKRLDGTSLSADSLSKKILELMQVANVSGVAVSVFNNNKPVFSKTFGLANVPAKKPLNAGTVMYGASFSKAVFAYTVMQLVQEKKLDLDKPLHEYLSIPLPEFMFTDRERGYQDLKLDQRYKKITARMCLAHTTGFPNWRWIEPDEKLKIKFEPGSRYSYSGEGIQLLQFVIMHITEKDYETLVQHRVFKPLGMRNTSQLWQKRFERDFSYGHNEKGQVHDFEKWDAAGAAGSMSTTLVDYTKFFGALMAHKGLLSATFDEMIRPQVRIRALAQFGPFAKVEGSDNDDIQLSYGLGLGLIQTPYGTAFFKEGHDDGWGHYSIAFPDRRVGIVIMTNNDNGESIFKPLLDYAIKDLYTPWRWNNYVPYNEKVAEEPGK